MPRLAPALLHQARHKNPLLPILLRECRDTRSAENELRWLKEHALALRSSSDARTNPSRRKDLSLLPGWRTTLRNFVRRRAKGEPLQYILGTQPFGDLEILCKKGVLIPRPETETYTAKFAALVQTLRREGEESATKKQGLRILDLCTGTGCISLLLHSVLKPPEIPGQALAEEVPDRSVNNESLEILGIDISNTALRLAKDNLHHSLEARSLHRSAKHDVSFVRANVLSDITGNFGGQGDSPLEPGNGFNMPNPTDDVPSVWEVLQHEGPTKDWDILISNPPYISPRHFSPGGTTIRSVRRWEPQLALVPQPVQLYTSQYMEEQRDYGEELQRGDEFYPPLLELTKSVGAKAVVLEVGDDDQAIRVKNCAARYFVAESETVTEIWRDDGTVVDMVTSNPGCDALNSGSRAVVVWRCSWARWRKGRVD